MDPSPDEVERRQRVDWYNEYQNGNSVRVRAGCGPFHCPCCGCKTLDQRCDFDICPVCFWEDDGQDDHDADVVRGGPNGALSLSQARQNYIRIGACEESMLENVRPPLPHELPDSM